MRHCKGQKIMATRSKWDKRKKKIMKENTFIAKKMKNIWSKKNGKSTESWVNPIRAVGANAGLPPDGLDGFSGWIVDTATKFGQTIFPANLYIVNLG